MSCKKITTIICWTQKPGRIIFWRIIFLLLLMPSKSSSICSLFSLSWEKMFGFLFCNTSICLSCHAWPWFFDLKSESLHCLNILRKLWLLVEFQPKLICYLICRSENRVGIHSFWSWSRSRSLFVGEFLLNCISVFLTLIFHGIFIVIFSLLLVFNLIEQSSWLSFSIHSFF